MPRIALILLTLLVGRNAESQTSASPRQEGYGSAIGIGFGINKVNFDDRSQSKGGTYFTGNFRFNFWDGDEPPRPGARRSRLRNVVNTPERRDATSVVPIENDPPPLPQAWSQTTPVRKAKAGRAGR